MAAHQTNFVSSALAGWATLLAVLAAFIFSRPQEPPTVGYAGAFVVWGIIFSLFYLVDFVLVAVLYHRVLRPWLRPLAWWWQSLVGASLFSVVALLFVAVYGSVRPLDLEFCCGTAALCGFICFLVLRRDRPET